MATKSHEKENQSTFFFHEHEGMPSSLFEEDIKRRLLLRFGVRFSHIESSEESGTLSFTYDNRDQAEALLEKLLGEDPCSLLL